MTDGLEGFKNITEHEIPYISFNTTYQRFYVSIHARREFGLPLQSYVGMAHDFENSRIAIDRKGNRFYLDKSGYITTKKYAQMLVAHSDKYKGALIRFIYNEKLSNDRFIVFDEGEIEYRHFDPKEPYRNKYKKDKEGE